MRTGQERSGAAIGVLAAAMPWLATAQAQESGPAAALEEIVVTARHREESLQDVPLSISAVRGEAIAAGRLGTVQQLEYAVPNLVFGETGSSGETFVGIRGIGDFSRNIGFDTRVGVYIDGVFAGQSLAVDQGLVDVAQVEVMRGPQGTLFGKNSSSGVINIVSQRPVPGQHSGEVAVRVGNLDTLAGTGIVNLPLGANSALRLAVVAQNQDGYIDNLAGGGRLMSNDHVLGRARWRFQPDDALDVNLALDFRRQDNDLLFLEPDASYENAVGNPAAAAPFVVDQDADLVDDNSGRGGGLQVDYTLASGFRLTSITGYRSVDRRVGSDEDATRVFTLHARYFVDDFSHFTQELRLASPAERRLRYVLGAFWFDQDATTGRKVALGPGFGGPPAGVDAAVQDSAVSTRNWALFVNGDLELGERVTASGGLRWSDERKVATIRQTVFPGFGLATFIDESFRRSEDYVTGTASLRYRASDRVATYLTWASGYKSGGFNVDLVPTTADLLYDAEEVDSFELGLKSELLEGRLRLNLAAFHAEYDDYQVFQFRFDPFSGTTALLVSNAAAVTTEGLELDGTAQLGERVTLDFGLGYADATFDDFPGGAVDGATGAPINVAGNRLARAPQWTASLAGQYRFRLGSAAAALQLGYSWRDTQYFNPDNRANSRQGGYGLWNAALDLEFGAHWRFGVYARNLADQEFRTMRGVSFLGVPFSLYGQPRSYGIEATWRY